MASTTLNWSRQRARRHAEEATDDIRIFKAKICIKKTTFRIIDWVTFGHILTKSRILKNKCSGSVAFWYRSSDARTHTSVFRILYSFLLWPSRYQKTSYTNFFSYHVSTFTLDNELVRSHDTVEINLFLRIKNIHEKKNAMKDNIADINFISSRL